MKMKKSWKVIFTAILVIVLAFGVNIIVSFASQRDELLNKSKQTDQQINETKEDISEIKQDMSEVMKEVQELVVQISEYETQITELDTQIGDIQTNIETTTEKLAKTEKDLEEKQKLLDERLVALYESGSTRYIDVLLNSKGITDFISNYYLIEELAEHDTELIETVRKTKQEIEETKKQLEESKQQLETAKQEQVAKQNALAVVRDEKTAKVANLSTEEKKLEAQLSQFEKDKQQIYSELASLSAPSNSSSGGSTQNYPPSSPSSSGYIFPIPGLSKSNISNRSFPSYPGHDGVDININVVGKSVVAVKSGTVVQSTAVRNADGSYRSYGEYVTIDHHDGTRTLYAHLRAGSRTVSPGQTVSQGQVIGTVGSTGNSTGDHLHFGVFLTKNGGTTVYAVNPLNYLP